MKWHFLWYNLWQFQFFLFFCSENKINPKSQLCLRITKMTTIQPEGDVNVCTKFQVKSIHTSGDISHKTTNMNLIVQQEETSGDHYSH